MPSPPGAALRARFRAASGARAAQTSRFVLAAAIMARVLAARCGKAEPLELAVAPLLGLVQDGCFPLGATFDGTPAGGYLVLVA